jgi:hypothetical protein
VAISKNETGFQAAIAVHRAAASKPVGSRDRFAPIATERREAGAAQLIVDAQRGEVHGQQAAADPVLPSLF